MSENLERLMIDRLVDLARNPTQGDLDYASKRLNAVQAERDRISKERDKLFAEQVAAEPHITELFKAAEALLVANTPSKSLAGRDRLRKAIKAAEPHVDLIPF